jgi:hypothetical protein
MESWWVLFHYGSSIGFTSSSITSIWNPRWLNFGQILIELTFSKKLLNKQFFNMFSKFGKFLFKDKEYTNKIFILIFLFFAFWWNFTPKKKLKLSWVIWWRSLSQNVTKQFCYATPHVKVSTYSYLLHLNPLAILIRAI